MSASEIAKRMISRKENQADRKKGATAATGRKLRGLVRMLEGEKGARDDEKADNVLLFAIHQERNRSQSMLLSTL